MEWSKQGLETANSTSNCGWGLKLKGRTRGGTGNTSGTATGFSVFFSSRRRHTRYWRDWSSDVCSSDLESSLVAEVRTTAYSPPGSGERQGGDEEDDGDGRVRVQVRDSERGVAGGVDSVEEDRKSVV